jgi:hypothetical protein
MLEIIGYIILAYLILPFENIPFLLKSLQIVLTK